MTFTICQLNLNNVDTMRTVLTMFGQAFADVATYCDRPPSGDYLQHLLARDSFIVLAAITDDGHVVGGLVGYVLDKFEQERSEIYIYDLAVASPYRRQGIATALVEALREVARQRSAYVIFVQADPPDAAAVALYTKLGVREDVLHFDIEVQPPSKS